ncbi:MAG: response regulator [Alphaproteobacteria bacterium]|nr:response regulator [Alphaproteobacteria bacterium]
MEKETILQDLLKRIPARVAHFRIARSMRPSREKPRLLVVEDQLFSQKLLQEILRHDYILDMAVSAHEGLDLFLDNAHDIVLLDIELTDESGHSLAKVIRTLDPGVFMAMVTANNSVEDVALAKTNNVDGFIVKPYSKQKVFECLEKFEARQSAGQSKGNEP